MVSTWAGCQIEANSVKSKSNFGLSVYEHYEKITQKEILSL